MNIKAVLKKYRVFILAMLAMGVLTLINTELGLKALRISVYSTKEMLLVIPPVFILLGLLDVWVPREIMLRHIRVLFDQQNDR